MKKRISTHAISFSTSFLQPVLDVTMTRLSDTRVFLLRDTNTLFAVMVGFNYKQQFFFTVHVHNGLVRRKAILFLLLLQDVHRCEASLVLATSEAILSSWISICRRHRQLATNTEGEHCPLFYQKKNLFSLCFDTMLYGISCVCARAAHIDLVLVPCIGTSIDLEFSLRRCLQSKTAHWQASEVLQKI